MNRETRDGAEDSRAPRGTGNSSSKIEIDAAALARVIREEKGLPVTDDEADRLAGLLEASKDDDEFLANTVSAVRFLLDRLGALDAG